MPDRVRLQTSTGDDQWDDVSSVNPIPVSVVTGGEAGGLVQIVNANYLIILA